MYHTLSRPFEYCFIFDPVSFRSLSTSIQSIRLLIFQVQAHAFLPDFDTHALDATGSALLLLAVQDTDTPTLLVAAAAAPDIDLLGPADHPVPSFSGSHYL